MYDHTASSRTPFRSLSNCDSGERAPRPCMEAACSTSRPRATQRTTQREMQRASATCTRLDGDGGSDAMYLASMTSSDTSSRVTHQADCKSTDADCLALSSFITFELHQVPECSGRNAVGIGLSWLRHARRFLAGCARVVYFPMGK